jgi:Ca2+-transporting ATPase
LPEEKKYEVTFADPKKVKKVVDGMRVLARSTGEDKLILVEALK